MKRSILTYGIISGLIVSIMMAITMPFQKEMGFDAGMAIGYTTMILAFSLIFFAIQSYRKTYGGTISFKQSFLIGLGIAAICSVFYVLTWLIIYYNFMPNFMDDYTAHHIENMRKAGKPEKLIQKTIEEMAMYKEMYKNPVYVALLTIIEIFPLGILVPLIAAFVELYKNKKTENAAA